MKITNFFSAFRTDIINHYRKKYTLGPVGLIMGDVQFVKLYVPPFPISDVTVKGKEEEVDDLQNIFNDGAHVCRNIYVTSETGLGKTAFMKWITLCWCKAHSIDKAADDFPREDREEMFKFEFLFYVSIGDKTFDEYHVDNMIYSSIVNALTEPRTYGMDFLETILKTENCLIILDGIDENASKQSTMLPDRTKRPTASHITTCTTQTFERLKINSTEVEKHIQISALEREKSKKLSMNILSVISEGKDETPNEDAKQYPNDKYTVLFSPCVSSGIMEGYLNFHEMLIEKKISDLERFPVLLTHILSLWLVEGKIDQSRCEIYSGAVHVLIKRGCLRKLFHQQLLKFETNEPAKEECLHIFEPYHPFVMHLGCLAYKTLLRLPRGPCLVFEEVEAVEILSTEVSFPPHDIIETGLSTGILCMQNQIENFGENHFLSFFDRSVHELLAALYMSCNDSTVEQVKLACPSALALLEFADVFVFMSGFNETLAKDILEHLKQVIHEDERFFNYRCSVNSLRIPEIKFIQDKVIESIEECRDSARGKLHLSLEDAVVDISCGNESYRRNLEKVIRDGSVRSLSIEEYGSKEDEYRKYSIFEGLGLSNLVKLRVEGYLALPKFIIFSTLQYVHLKSIDFAQNCISWEGMVALFHLSMIEALGLENIRVTHDQLNDILQNLNGKTSLKQIVLRIVKCTQRETDRVELDLRNHNQLFLLEVYDIPVSKVQVNSDRLEDFKIGSLPHNSASLLFQGFETASSLKRISCTSIKCDHDINEMILALPKFTNLACLGLTDIDLDKRTINLPPEMNNLQVIKLFDVRITVKALSILIKKIQLYKHKVSVSIVGCTVNPENEFKEMQNRIRSSPEFIVLFDDDSEMEFRFSTSKRVPMLHSVKKKRS